ncbi:MAG TPA: hypothetical protein VFN78_14830 [Ktedonobacterales bacterium]|nr:hypothetical protein [Ktedonobacterales bacterium]
MGLFRNLAHTIFGFLLLTALWVTALSFLSMRPASTTVMTDLGVDALNPFLVSKGIGISETTYAKLQQAASAFPDKALPIAFIKPQITGSELKGLSYNDAMRMIYGHVAAAYYDGGPTATFNLPGPLSGAVQSFALFPEQYDAAVKSAPLPTWMQPFLLYTGLSPETFTSAGHQRIEGMLPKFWTAALLLAGVILLLNFLSRRNPTGGLGLAILHGAWPPLAFFGVLWLLGHLYPERVQPIAAAFGVIAGAFVPTYLIAAAAGVGIWVISKFAGSLVHMVGKSTRAARAPVPVPAGRSDQAPAYRPGAQPSYGSAAPVQPPAPTYQPGGPSAAGWNAPARQSWEQPAQPGWGSPQPAPRDPRSPNWNQPRPWDEPDQAAQDDGGQGWGSYRPSGPDDPTAPRW